MATVVRSPDGSGGSLRSASKANRGSDRGMRVSSSGVPPIGDRLRAERAHRGVTVRGLAREVGVSASLISQIENGRSQPSVSTLYAITTALGISIEDLFAPVATEPADDSGDEFERVGVADRLGTADQTDAVAANDGDVSGMAAGQARSDGAPSVRTPRPALSDRGRRVGPVVRPDNRERLTLDTGVVWELLGQVPDVHADFMLVTYQPGGSSSSSGTLMRHSGIEYGYLISGELVLTLGFDEHRLHPDDAISFDSTTPHGYRNEGTEPAVGVWFVLERVH